MRRDQGFFGSSQQLGRGGQLALGAAPFRLRRAYQLAEEAAGVGAADGGHLLGSAGGDDLAPAFSPLGAEVDEPVGGLDHVEVVLDDDDGVAGVDEAAA